MDLELQALKEEVSLLTQKVEILEKKENRRKAFTYVKILVKVILILGAMYGIYWGYQYLSKELPRMMEEKIKEINPINGLFNK
jgi:hypothetical protein